MSGFHVPENQTVCWAIYKPSVINEAGVTAEEAEKFSRQMMRAFDFGEPIWSAALEIKMLVELNRDYRPEKTPLQLAKRVVRM
jgi:hypothetical protein